MKTVLISPPSPNQAVPPNYALAILRSGAKPLPLRLPTSPASWDGWARAALARADALVLIGGPDADPALFGEDRMPECGKVVAQRDSADIAIVKAALAQRKPLLAICRGIQVLAIAAGGTLYQDIPAQIHSNIDHYQQENPLAHPVKVEPGTLLRRLLRVESLTVSSRHHQAVKAPGTGLVVSARSDDGVIEAAEFADGRPVLGVQWHPETLAAEHPLHQMLFDWLVRAAEAGE